MSNRRPCEADRWRRYEAHCWRLDLRRCSSNAATSAGASSSTIASRSVLRQSFRTCSDSIIPSLPSGISIRNCARASGTPSLRRFPAPQRCPCSAKTPMKCVNGAISEIICGGIQVPS